MPYQRQDRRTQASDDWGKPQVTYPYGLPNFPEIEERSTVSQAKDLPAALSNHPNTAEFPTALLVGYQTSIGGNRDTNWRLTYKTLPGPLISEEPEDQGTALPILKTSQEVPANASYPCGDLAPVQIAVQSISLGANPVVATGSDLGLPLLAWVTFTGTTATPSMNGVPVQIIATGANSITVAPASPITGAQSGAAGTVASTNWISRELLSTDNANVKRKVETMLANPVNPPELLDTYYNFNYPSFIEAFNFWTSVSFSSDISTGVGFLTSNSVDGSVSTPEQAGFHGQSKARRMRSFFSGPPTLAFRDTYPPTKIIPTEGQAVIRGFAQSGSVFPGAGTGQSISQSFHYKTERFGPALTGPNPAINAEPIPGLLGPFTITAVNIGTPNLPILTVTPAHNLTATNGGITITGSATVPLIDNQWTVAAIPDSTHIQIQTPFNLTGNTAGGQIYIGAVATVVLDMPQSTPPMLVSKLNISGITTNAAPVITTTGGATSGVHYLQVGQYVYLDNTGTSPSLDKQYWEVTAVTSNTFTIAPGLGTITGSSGVGTMQECLTVAEEPRRIGTAAAWDVIVWLIQVAYTSGQSA